MRPSASFEVVEAWVRDHLGRCQEPGPRAIEDICQVAPRPGGEVVACTVLLRERPLTPARRALAIVDLATGQVVVPDLAYDETSWPAWSPDGSRLVVVGTSDQGAAAVVLESPLDTPSVSATSDVPGFVELAHWSPDGTRLALQVAMPGAEISDVYGSGRIGGPTGEPWRPRVLPDVAAGKRLPYVWSPGDRESRLVCDVNVWEVTWSGNDALLALTSEGADEGAWYAASLSRLRVGDGRREELFVAADQVSVPRSSPSGNRWSVLSGLQSDRGLPAGELVVGDGARPGGAVHTQGIHVTDQRWLDEATVLVAGLRGLSTVFATIDVDHGVVRELWSGSETSGEHFPEVAAVQGSAALVVMESHRSPPTLGLLEQDGFRGVLSADGPGAAYQVRQAGETTAIRWTSSDGQEIEGLLTVPEGAPEGRLPVVLQVHGGPTHAVRDTWAGRDPQVSCLVARGYAVLRPNPRGSTGRGAAFAEAVRGDMGGLDVDDLVSGVQHLVDVGLADPRRLGIAGISYGGFMASWVPTRTDIFAASVARSPCSDWLLQHLTSNIAEFDVRFIEGDPFDPASQYAARSPLRYADRIRTPLLLTAGLDDLATPPTQAQVLYSALRERGVETRLVLYPEEGHGVRQPLTLVDQCARMVEWFDRHLGTG
jgi:dipeptidyl aminopeptidase/acylaminoacyl peptidase